jgi:glycosyltransferase involved in cell wall biosynthesis
MSVGRPVIYSSTGPGPEIVEDGVSGLLCDPFNPDDIADKLIRLLQEDSLAATLGRNARRRVTARFNKGQWIQKNLAVYEKCIAMRSRG